MDHYIITGSNLFGQWQCNCDNIIINEFREYSVPNVDLYGQAILSQINWSYNIFNINGLFYISGFWGGKEQQFTKIPLPPDMNSTDNKLSLIGNDYKLVLYGENSESIWVIDLTDGSLKKIPFNIEEPITDVNKKIKLNNKITKAVISNESCLYMTSQGNIYCGILPTHVNTKHCKGKICDIQCGYEHFVILTDEGRVYTWGGGRRLQLGHGDISNQELPMEVEALAGITITKISTGGWHSLALSKYGDVYAWGWNDTGQLGIKGCNNELESFSVPTLVDLYDDGKEYVENVKSIACGSRHSALVLEDNTVWTSGCNKYGQLGFSSEKDPIRKHFKKVYQCNSNCSVMCGPWSTVIVNT